MESRLSELTQFIMLRAWSLSITQTHSHFNSSGKLPPPLDDLTKSPKTAFSSPYLSYEITPETVDPELLLYYYYNCYFSKWV